MENKMQQKQHCKENNIAREELQKLWLSVSYAPFINVLI